MQKKTIQPTFDTNALQISNQSQQEINISFNSRNCSYCNSIVQFGNQSFTMEYNQFLIFKN